MPMATATADSALLKALRAPIEKELQAVDALMAQELCSTIPLIQTVTERIIQCGGKRLRPLLVLLCAKACGYDHDTEHHELATVVEFIHTATLLHDDVVDSSELRRGSQTSNSLFGNPVSVLVGDFLYSRAFQILAKRNNIPVMKLLAHTTNQISEGEVWQLMNRHDPDIDERTYLEVIRRKTAELFAVSAKIGAIIGTQNTSLYPILFDFGLHLGMAYQIIDDLMDYTADVKVMGKNIGDDLAEGKVTLPLIFARLNSDPSDHKRNL